MRKHIKGGIKFSCLLICCPNIIPALDTTSLGWNTDKKVTIKSMLHSGYIILIFIIFSAMIIKSLSTPNDDCLTKHDNYAKRRPCIADVAYSMISMSIITDFLLTMLTESSNKMLATAVYSYHSFMIILWQFSLNAWLKTNVCCCCD